MKERFEVLDRELDYRRTAGIVVKLMLHPPDQVYITYEHGDDRFQADVPSDKAYHAFHHPNLYRTGDAPERTSIYASPTTREYGDGGVK